MMRMTMASLAAALAVGLCALVPAALAQEHGDEAAAAGGHEAMAIAEQHWSWDGLFGGFDQAQLQRGYLVYESVCSTCHSMNLVAFRHLEPLGFDEDQIKAIATNRTVGDMDSETGAAITRPALPADYFPNPYPNPIAATFTHGGVIPPDLSVMAKARAAGPDYLFALLTGYGDPPAGVEVPDGKFYNAVFPGHAIGMAPPLADGLVGYIDGTPNTLEQSARDVSAFLAWAAEPYMVERKELGVKVLLFLIVLAGIAYAVKRKVWSDVEH